jgi:hypothetical protein
MASPGGAHGLTADELLDPTSLPIGQQLFTPSPTEIRNSHAVQPGDTLFTIAQRFDASVVALSGAFHSVVAAPHPWPPGLLRRVRRGISKLIWCPRRPQSYRMHEDANKVYEVGMMPMASATAS